ncbi:hypothetical protein D3C71_1722910 [compost metagenome]
MRREASVETNHQLRPGAACMSFIVSCLHVIQFRMRNRQGLLDKDILTGNQCLTDKIGMTVMASNDGYRVYGRVSQHAIYIS